MDYLPNTSMKHAAQYNFDIDAATILLKALTLPTLDGYDTPNVKNEVDWEADAEFRRAIHPISNYFNNLGVFRSGFVKGDNDDLAGNAYYAVAEKAMMDYIASLDWTVMDRKGKEEVDDATSFLKRPNPQQNFRDVRAVTLKDLMRYDAGAIVKSFDHKGNMIEMKPYLGTEFWAEIDRMFHVVDSESQDNYQVKYRGYWSQGYIANWWQRSRTGLYISFKPDEIAYMRMYPKSDDIYGTDFIQRLKYQIQYLIDSTRAAGKTFANGIVPSIIWNHPEIFDMNQLYQRMNEVKKENQGSYNFGKILHTVRNEKVETLAKSLHDMEWLEGQRFVSQLVWSMWGFQPEEFTGEGVNRATAQVGRNITKSKTLYPIMTFYESIINEQILPYLEGYPQKKGKPDYGAWRFKFIRELDLDDELKVAQIMSVKAQTVTVLRGVGVKTQDALKLTKMMDDPDTIEIEDIPLDIDEGTGPDQAKFGNVQKPMGGNKLGEAAKVRAEPKDPAVAKAEVKRGRGRPRKEQS